MKVIYRGFLCPETGKREERDGLTIGKVYEAEREVLLGVVGGWRFLDDCGVPRRRPANDCQQVYGFARRAWALFTSLQKVLA